MSRLPEISRPHARTASAQPEPVLYADETDAAIAISRRQQQVLDQIEQLLKRMRLLASISHETEKPDRELLHDEFHQLADELAGLLATQHEGQRLFQGTPRTVSLQRGRKRLILQGAHRLQDSLEAIQSASLRTSRDAGATRAVLRHAFAHLVSDQAVAMENSTRLAFLARHLQEVEETI